MTLEFLQKEMIAAMKAKDKFRKETISSLISAAKNIAIDKKCRDNITEGIVNDAILKEQKMIQDMIDECPADRTELLEEYKKRMAIIKEFVPKMMTEDEIKEFVNKTLIELTGANVIISPKIHGMVMKNISPVLKGKADMKLVNQIVSELLKG